MPFLVRLPYRPRLDPIRRAEGPIEQRRLHEIRQKSDATFHFVRTEQNPADIGSRGSSPSELRDKHLWWHGPEWLCSSIEEWPEELTFSISNDEGSLEDDVSPDLLESNTYAVKQEPAELPEPPIDLLASVPCSISLALPFSSCDGPRNGVQISFSPNLQLLYSNG